MTKEQIKILAKEYADNGNPFDQDIAVKISTYKHAFIKGFNLALELACENVEVICDSSETFQSIDEQSILKLKINEQGTDTTEV